jgi:hypothetical protein
VPFVDSTTYILSVPPVSELVADINGRSPKFVKKPRLIHVPDDEHAVSPAE